MCFGLADELGGINASEAVGSMAVEMNAVDNQNLPIDAKELSFASNHASGVQLVFGDGHATCVARNISRRIWAAWGTRDGNESMDQHK